MARPSDIEEDLLSQQGEDEGQEDQQSQWQEELEEANQQGRVGRWKEIDQNQDYRARLPTSRRESEENRRRNEEALKRIRRIDEGAHKLEQEAVKELGKKAATRAGAQAAGSAATGAAAASSGIWVPVLIIVVVVLLLILLLTLVVGGITSACTQEGWKGTLVRAGSKVASWTGFVSKDFCNEFADYPVGSGATDSVYGQVLLGQNTDAQARAFLLQHGITVNHPQPVTNLEGINQKTLDEIVAFKESCDAWAKATGRFPNTCAVVFTGGTEAGHATNGTCTHAKGYKFDMNMSANTDAFIRNSEYFRFIGVRSDGARLYMFNETGAVYADEAGASGGSHWDVVTAGCGTPNP
jgi:hypothetical protein